MNTDLLAPASDLIGRYDQRVPRYTSYPTAPHFGPAVDGRLYGQWLAALPAGTELSLYLHVPFCDRLCLFCGCTTRVAHKVEPLEAYARTLAVEIDRVADAIGQRLPVAHVHWGGGTPTSLPAHCITDLFERLAARFDLRGDVEVAVEIDPRTLDDDRVAALRDIGMTRASVGVQDFDAAVQTAIGRVQPYDMTARVIEQLRAAGARSMNVDMLYGLPLQTVASVERTAHQALTLAPDRIAVFGYAHVPWMKRHQTALKEPELPDAAERFAQRNRIDDILRAAGLAAVGLDHYAQPGDGMASAVREGTLRRNFQGYTTDTAAALIGFGASSIGSLPQGYVQNVTDTAGYEKAVAAGGLPVARGVALSEDDRRRRHAIERLMCDMQADFAGAEDLLDAAAERLSAMAEDGIVRREGAALVITERGRPFMRNVAALFDAYLNPTEQRHSRAI
jgi:oxygen-independent coproporphyrinogen III oxidase